MARKYPEGFYVYLHSRKSDGLVFYVGKGSGDRAWKLKDNVRKNPHWSNVKSKHGVDVSIFREGMSELCALSLEKILIHLHNKAGSPLVNMTSGGEGVSGYINPNWRKIYSSLGEKFDRMGDALILLKNEGHTRATSSGINQCCNGHTKSYMGRAWSYDGFPDHPDETGRKATIFGAKSSFSKKVYSSLGEEFSSITDAVDFLKSVGFESSGAGNISRSCKSLGRSMAYGRVWSFDGFQHHIHESRIQRVSAANKIRISKSVVMDGLFIFKSQEDAASYMRVCGYPKASSSRIGRACSGKSITAYGHTWKYAR